MPLPDQERSRSRFVVIWRHTALLLLLAAALVAVIVAVAVRRGPQPLFPVEEEDVNWRVETDLAAPGLLSPADRVPYGRPIIFRWSAVDNAAQYELAIIDPQSGFPALKTRLDTTSWDMGDLSLNLEPGRRYSWRVAGLDSGGRHGPAALGYFMVE